MIAKVLHTFSVRDYAELYQMYKEKELGLVEQRIPENIVEQIAGDEGTDEELIINLLAQDPDNMYHVKFIDDSEDGYFEISYMAFGLKKNFNELVSEYVFMFGEDGLWEEFKKPLDDQYHDASVIGELNIYCGSD
jgi:hypothetical protein